MKKLLLVLSLPGLLCAGPLSRTDKAKIAGWSALAGTYGLLGAACLVQASEDYDHAYTKHTIDEDIARPTNELVWRLISHVGVDVGAAACFGYCAARAAQQAKGVYDAREGQIIEFEDDDREEESRIAAGIKALGAAGLTVSSAAVAYTGSDFLRFYASHGYLRREDKKQALLMALAYPALFYAGLKAARVSYDNARKVLKPEQE